MEVQESHSIVHHPRSHSSATTSNYSNELYLGSKHNNNKTNYHHNPLILPLGSPPIPPKEPSIIELEGRERPSIDTGGIKNALTFKNKFLEATSTAVSGFPSASYAPPLRKISTSTVKSN